MFLNKLENLIHKINFFSSSKISIVHTIDGNVVPYPTQNGVSRIFSKKIIEPIIDLKNMKFGKNSLLDDNFIFHSYPAGINIDDRVVLSNIDNNFNNLNTFDFLVKNKFFCIENLNIEEYDSIKKIIVKKYFDYKKSKVIKNVEILEINSLF